MSIVFISYYFSMLCFLLEIYGRAIKLIEYPKSVICIMGERIIKHGKCYPDLNQAEICD